MRTSGLSILLFATLTLAACNRSGGSGQLAGQSEYAAAFLRESCVEQTLGVLIEAADRMAPLCEAADLEAARSLAQAFDAELIPARAGQTVHRLHLPSTWIAPPDTRLEITLQYVDPAGDPVREPVPGGSLWIRFEGDGGTMMRISGMLEARSDPALGLVLAGDLGADFESGCSVSVTVEDLAGVLVGDLDPLGAGLLMRSGGAGIWVHSPISGILRGRAAFAGRDALVFLRLGRVFSEGEVAFVRG